MLCKLYLLLQALQVGLALTPHLKTPSSQLSLPVTNSMPCNLRQTGNCMEGLLPWAGIVIWLRCRAGRSICRPEGDWPRPGAAVRAVHPG